VVLVVVLARGGSDDGSGTSAGDEPDADVTTPAREASVPIVRVVDGDTARALVDGHEESVRYIGIDTPEVDPSIGVECFGAQASARNKQLVEDETVRLVYDAERRDRYGRLLAYVYVGETFVNAELVRGGFATTLEIAPNDSKAGLFDRLQQEAANAGRGLWGAC